MKTLFYIFSPLTPFLEIFGRFSDYYSVATLKLVKLVKLVMRCKYKESEKTKNWICICDGQNNKVGPYVLNNWLHTEQLSNFNYPSHLQNTLKPPQIQV